MPVKMRLQRFGRKKRPFYHIVVADSRTARNGKCIERIGDYNPLTIPATINLDTERAFKWVMDGAKPTDTVRKILTFKGVLYKKHLQLGVKKGAFSQEVADKKFEEWTAAKASKVQERIDKEMAKIEEKRAKRNAEESEKRAAKVVAEEPAAEEEASEEAATAEASAEETTTADANTDDAKETEAKTEDTSEEKATEEAPKEEAAAEDKKEETEEKKEEAKKE